MQIFSKSDKFRQIWPTNQVNIRSQEPFGIDQMFCKPLHIFSHMNKIFNWYFFNKKVPNIIHIMNKVHKYSIKLL